MPKRKRYLKIYQKNRKKRRVSVLLKLFVFSLFILTSSFLLVFIYYAKDLPRPEKFTEKQIVQPTRIYDRSGEVLLYEIYGEEKRKIVSLEQIPKHLKDAVITTEDINFYSHFGLDIKAIFRAISVNLKLKKPIQGGSTITQQLIRSSFLTLEKTLERKTREVILALELERRYSKDQILEWYLNQVPFGSNTYGVEAASQVYFKKPVKDISLAEAALLSSLIQAPSYLSPYGYHKDELLIRKDYILDRMVQENYITEDKGRLSKEEEIQFSEIIHPIKAPHFVLMVKDYLIEKYGENFLKQKGVKVYTTLNWNFQEIAEKAIEEGAAFNKNFNAHNASLVAIDPKTGEILALVGSRDYFGEIYPEECTPGLNCQFEAKVNVAIYGEGRQPGSAFKPFVYAQAFKGGLTPESIVWDVKTNFGPGKDNEDYIPENYDGKFRGPVTLRQALAQSLNVPSVKVLYLAGLKKSLDLARKMGITTLDKPLSWYGLSLVLGGGEVKLLDMVSAFGIFAANGQKVSPVSILKIEDYKGNIIEENKKTKRRILESHITSLINDILSDNEARAPMFGLNSSLYIQGYEVAAKTGTTEGFRDAWTIGYTPSIVAGVWVGNNDGTSMAEKPGVVLAGPIWKNFMQAVLPSYPKESFTPIEETSEEEIKEEADESTPHSILYYINKEDYQFEKWEQAIKDLD